MKSLEGNYKRIIIKIGSSLFYHNDNKLDFSIVNNIVDQLSFLVKDKKEIVIVSSGAIALGMSILGWQKRPKELSLLQASAALGQNQLMDIYSKLFKKNSLNCAQLLLTRDDFADRRRYLNAKNTINTLLRLSTIPVINENDTVSTEEIKFGDNDQLSALVSSLVSADLLVVLSDVDGLLDKDKKTVIRVVDKITPYIKGLACPTDKKTSVGGMITKIEAAKIAVGSGIPCVIVNGRRKDIVLSVVTDPKGNGTFFMPKEDCLAAKKRWIAFGTKTKGKIMIDKGAKNALMNNKSLLSVGVVAVQGDFNFGDIVNVADEQQCEFARGKVGLSSKQLDKIKGIRSDKEVIHRDNIVIL